MDDNLAQETAAAALEYCYDGCGFLRIPDLDLIFHTEGPRQAESFFRGNRHLQTEGSFPKYQKYPYVKVSVKEKPEKKLLFLFRLAPLWRIDPLGDDSLALVLRKPRLRKGTVG